MTVDAGLLQFELQVDIKVPRGLERLRLADFLDQPFIMSTEHVIVGFLLSDNRFPDQVCAISLLPLNY